MAWFEAHASDYDAWYDSELGRYVDSVEKGLIEELAEPVPGERALDIGCGTGKHSIWLAEKGLTGLGRGARIRRGTTPGAPRGHACAEARWPAGPRPAHPRRPVG
jgi:SAM-dependent methyltransferase